MDHIKLAAQLEIDEDRRTKPYKCTSGKLTIGVGRNLDDRGLSDDEIDYILQNDITIVEQELDAQLPWWREMNDVRQNVLANMCFNLGIKRLKGFVNTLEMMKNKRYDAAALGMMNSLWARQVGDRAKRLSTMMRTGEFL